MARAKRTDRSEARRRYRQTIAAEDAAFAEGLEPDPDALPAAARPDRPSAPRTPTAAAGRPGLLTTLRTAVQPAPILEDLRALPKLVLRTKAFIVPAALTVAAGVGILLPGMQDNMLAVLAFQAFLVPPPLAASFLGGLLAPRASWAMGGLVGLGSAIVFTVVVLLYPETTAQGGAVASTAAQRQEMIAYALFASPTMGIAVGAFAGFYRRFLRSASPGQQPTSNRQRRAASRR